jgi:NAD(P)-dependent dehydrogenase (short-subunit alcohol dehydrogenase family)
VVTGGAGGIGQACAFAARESGACVVVTDLDGDRAQTVAAAVDPAGEHSLAVATDVTNARHCRDLVAATVSRFGRVDGAVLAAGIARHVPLLDLTRGQWDAMIAVHLTGTFQCVQAFAAQMVTSGGALVYIASSVTLGVGPLHQAHYVAAKAGALGFVRAAARELGPSGIRVNAVSPGFTDTGLNDGLFDDADVRQRIQSTPLARIATPADVANVAMFLLGEASSFVTGQAILVNGGAQMY